MHDSRLFTGAPSRNGRRDRGASYRVADRRRDAPRAADLAFAPQNHLWLRMHDISAPLDGYIMPGEQHVAELLDFVRDWDRLAPLVVHCYMGISRSTASAFASVCALNPHRDEAHIAQALRRASPTATPNARIVSLADELLGRDGRMIAAIENIGQGVFDGEAAPFRLDLSESSELLGKRRPQHGPRIGNRRRGGRIGPAADQLAARITLVEIAIGEAQAGERAAKAVVVELLHPEARRDRQTRQMRAHRLAVDPDRAGRQSRETRSGLGRASLWCRPPSRRRKCGPRRRCLRSRYRRTACLRRRRAPVPAQALRPPPCRPPICRLAKTHAQTQAHAHEHRPLHSCRPRTMLTRFLNRPLTIAGLACCSKILAKFWSGYPIFTTIRPRTLPVDNAPARGDNVVKPDFVHHRRDLRRGRDRIQAGATPLAATATDT